MYKISEFTKKRILEMTDAEYREYRMNVRDNAMRCCREAERYAGLEKSYSEENKEAETIRREK